MEFLTNLLGDNAIYGALYSGYFAMVSFYLNNTESRSVWWYKFLEWSVLVWGKGKDKA